MWLATLNFGRYWARRGFGDARSNQSAGHVVPILDLCKNPKEDDGSGINHAGERLVTLSVPWQVVVFEAKTGIKWQ